MPKGFKPRAGAQAEVQALLDPFLRDLGRRVELKAKAKIRAAKIGDTGKLEQSVKAGPPQATVGSSKIYVRSVRFSKTGADVALIMHQGHKQITPPPTMVFQGKDGGWATVTPGGRNSKGEKTNQGYIRAVGGVPFLTESLKEAADEITTETQGKVHFSVIIRKPHLSGPAKPKLVGRVSIARRGGKRP